jgi:hypothetical protein
MSDNTNAPYQHQSNLGQLKSYTNVNYLINQQMEACPSSGLRMQNSVVYLTVVPETRTASTCTPCRNRIMLPRGGKQDDWWSSPVASTTVFPSERQMQLVQSPGFERDSSSCQNHIHYVKTNSIQDLVCPDSIFLGNGR